MNRFQHVNAGILVLRLWMCIRVAVLFVIMDSIQAMRQPGIYGLTHIGNTIGAALVATCIYKSKSAKTCCIHVQLIKQFYITVFTDLFHRNTQLTPNKAVTGIPHPTSGWIRATTTICAVNITWLIARIAFVNMINNDAKYDGNMRFGDVVLAIIAVIYFRYIMTLTSAIERLIRELGDEIFQIDIAQPPVETSVTVTSRSSDEITNLVLPVPVVNDSATAYQHSRPQNGSQEAPGPPIAVAIVPNADYSNGYEIPITYATASAVKVEQNSNALGS